MNYWMREKGWINEWMNEGRKERKGMNISKKYKEQFRF